MKSDKSTFLSHKHCEMYSMVKVSAYAKTYLFIVVILLAANLLSLLSEGYI